MTATPANSRAISFTSKVTASAPLGKTAKSHEYLVLAHGDQAAIVGLDTDVSMHTDDEGSVLPEWVLCSAESNDLDVDAELLNGVADKGRVEQAGKVVRIPCTPKTTHLAYVDNEGDQKDFWLAVVYGRHRYRAARQIFARDNVWSRMTVKVAGKSESFANLALDMLAENMTRRTMKPTKQAAEIQALRDSGLSLDRIAKRLGTGDGTAKDGASITEATVRNKLMLTKLISAVAEMVDDGVITVTAGYKIARLPESKQAAVAELAAGSGGRRLSGAQVQNLVSEALAVTDAPTPDEPEDMTSELDPDEPDDAPSSQLDLPGSSDDSSSDDKPSTERVKKPKLEDGDFTTSPKPKAADIDTMIEYLTGKSSPMRKKMVARVAALMLRWTRGHMSELECTLALGRALNMTADDMAIPEEPAAAE